MEKTSDNDYNYGQVDVCIIMDKLMFVFLHYGPIEVLSKSYDGNALVTLVIVNLPIMDFLEELIPYCGARHLRCVFKSIIEELLRRRKTLLRTCLQNHQHIILASRGLEVSSSSLRYLINSVIQLEDGSRLMISFVLILGLVNRAI